MFLIKGLLDITSHPSLSSLNINNLLEVCLDMVISRDGNFAIMINITTIRKEMEFIVIAQDVFVIAMIIPANKC